MVTAISITGHSRVGKSSFENKLQAVVSGQRALAPQVFASSAAAATCTQGLHITVTGVLGQSVTVLIDSEGLGNGEGPLNILDAQLCIAFLASNVHVSMSNCDFKDEAFAAAARVAVAGNNGGKNRIELDLNGNSLSDYKLIMLANQWKADDNAKDIFAQKWDEVTNPVHAGNIKILERIYGNQSIFVESIDHFGKSAQVAQQLNNPDSNESKQMISVADRIFSSATVPFQVNGIVMNGESYIMYLKELVTAVNVFLQDPNTTLVRVPGALSAIEATCEIAMSMALKVYNSLFNENASHQIYLPESNFEQYDVINREKSLTIFNTRTSQV
jgi:hypothetical protein